MKRFPLSHVFGVGYRIDLHVVALRAKAEEQFGDLFAQATELRLQMEDPGLPDAEYDARVAGLISGLLLRVRPLPERLRVGAWRLLSVDSRSRGEMVRLRGENDAEINVRSDYAFVSLLAEVLGECLYPAESYVGPLQHGVTGLEGLPLSFRRDVIGEADSDGFITIQGLERIMGNLSQAITRAQQHSDELMLTADGKPLSAEEYEYLAAVNQRRWSLVDVVDVALKIQSPVQCVPAYLREARINPLGEQLASLAS